MKKNCSRVVFLIAALAMAMTGLRVVAQSHVEVTGMHAPVTQPASQPIAVAHEPVVLHVAPAQFADPAHGDFTVVSGPKGMDAGAKMTAIGTNSPQAPSP